MGCGPGRLFPIPSSEIGKPAALLIGVKHAVFFERDGVLNHCERRGGRQISPVRFEQFVINPEARPLLQALKSAGFVVIVATNQPGIARGEIHRSELDLMHRTLLQKLPIDDILVCPYDDSSHPCCKPQPGLFIEAAFKWSLDLDHSFVVSNHWADAKAAHVAGCTSVMIDSPWVGKDHHDFIVPDLATAVRKIRQLHTMNSVASAAA